MYVVLLQYARPSKHNPRVKGLEINDIALALVRAGVNANYYHGPVDGLETIHRNARRKSLVAVLFSNRSTTYNETGGVKSLCRWLKGLKHQHRLCTKRNGLAQLLQETRKLTIESCKYQFQNETGNVAPDLAAMRRRDLEGRYEQWSCSAKVYRETAFMYSLSTSAFMYLVARGCAEGKLANCKCASHGKSDNVSKWQWGGCGDNTKFAKTFTNKFMQLKRKADNFWRNIIDTILKATS
ncbi:hypothetical protein NQ318_016623 [Aromia moschata]|uniref:Protein Wnt n=1 Tax=Aromia moschata TaxID=1265417 RepID=A0AAV8XM68_9CUCU|nr:hypothetical protein NQ318_016623 [Aromia moschata]